MYYEALASMADHDYQTGDDPGPRFKAFAGWFVSRGVSNRCFEVCRVRKFETKQLSVRGVWSWLLPV